MEKKVHLVERGFAEIVQMAENLNDHNTYSSVLSRHRTVQSFIAAQTLVADLSNIKPKF